MLNTLPRPKPKPLGTRGRKRRRGGIKRTPADAAFSDCVRERADWACERCGKKYIPPTIALQCCHFHGRGKWATRTNPRNADALCYGCHRYFTAHPAEFVEWKKKKLGWADFDMLSVFVADVEIAKASIRGDKDGSIQKHYLSELSRMRELRAQGKTGRIEFAGWYKEIDSCNLESAGVYLTHTHSE